MIDMGNFLLNRTVDGFLKIGTVGALRVVVEETYGILSKGQILDPLLFLNKFSCFSI